jgi:hypothetical protein
MPDTLYIRHDSYARHAAEMSDELPPPLRQFSLLMADISIALYAIEIFIRATPDITDAAIDSHC